MSLIEQIATFARICTSVAGPFLLRKDKDNSNLSLSNEEKSLSRPVEGPQARI
jgi:hypothetical protein